MSAIPNSNIRVITSAGKHADRVVLSQEDGEAIKVEIGNKGITQNIFAEVNSVVSGVETLANTYTVPVGKKFDLNSATCSGDNIAKFTVKINGAIIQTKRTWWSTGFNVDFDFREQILNVGDKVEIFVINNGSSSETFESTIIGGEYVE